MDLGPGNYRAKAAQAAGIIGADLATDGMRNIWWFLNAPQAVAQVAMFQGMRDATKNNAGLTGLHERESLIRNRNLRMAAAPLRGLRHPWVLATSFVSRVTRRPCRIR